MRPAAGSATRADTVALAASLLIALTALALPEGLRAPLASGMRSTVLFPFLQLQRESVRSAEYRADLDALRAERDSLVLRAADLPEVLRENTRLRGLLGLGQRLGQGFVTAEVLHQVGVSDGLTLVLSAGTAEGVAPLSPVLAPDGLVGLVQTVDAHTSIALAWPHPDFRASAVIEGARVFGLVQARRGERAGDVMELRGIAYRQQLRPGTRVLTSGLGSVYPRGVPIGTIESVLSESEGWERTYLVRPAVHPAEVGHVMILSPARATDDLTAAFVDSTTTRSPGVP